MARAGRNNEPDSAANSQLVQIIVDPKTRNLDKTAHDILQISELVMELMPTARIQSIHISDYFAIVRVLVPQGHGIKEAMLRLYQLKDEWKIRGCAFYKRRLSREAMRT